MYKLVLRYAIINLYRACGSKFASKMTLTRWRCCANMFKDGSFLYCDGVNYWVDTLIQNSSTVMIMASRIPRWIEISRPKTVAPVKAWTAKNNSVRILTQVRNFIRKNWVKSRSVVRIEYIRIPGVVLLRRRHFEYRHMQLSYLNKAEVLIILSVTLYILTCLVKYDIKSVFRYFDVRFSLHVRPWYLNLNVYKTSCLRWFILSRSEVH